MRIATWNVNSLKARIEAASRWLGEVSPDVVCLQELKLVDEAFPHEAIAALGYNAVVHGQKTYNGVAILAKAPIELVRKGLPGDESDDQARYIEALIPAQGRTVRIASIYLPNGNPAPGPKYDYKLAWMARLAAHTRDILALEEITVLAGDYNVIPQAEDVHDPSAWTSDALFLSETRAEFRALMNLGLTDAFRACHAGGGHYSFWDYQAGAWQRNNGIRIDHLLLSPQAADRLKGAAIDKDPRGWERPSDHVPVWCDLDV